VLGSPPKCEDSRSNRVKAYTQIVAQAGNLHTQNILVPVVLQWYYGGVTVVSQWSYSGVTVVLQWCYRQRTSCPCGVASAQECDICVTVVLQWCYGCVRVVLQ
jgi:hypothetical protein